MYTYLFKILISIFIIIVLIYSIKYNIISLPKENKSKYKSTGEKLTCQALEEIFNTEVINNYRPNELKNYKTGHNLEIDCWVPKYKIGVEYDGIQHRKWIKKFHSTYSDFINQQERDKLKEKLCKKSGIKLIRIPDYIDNYNKSLEERYNKIKQYIVYILYKENIIVY
jgi:very-short-patch-repair endonuclease